VGTTSNPTPGIISQGFIDRKLPGKIQIMCSLAKTSFYHWFEGVDERAGAIEHRDYILQS
jgi:hypothetical protein